MLLESQGITTVDHVITHFKKVPKLHCVSENEDLKNGITVKKIQIFLITLC